MLPYSTQSLNHQNSFASLFRGGGGEGGVDEGFIWLQVSSEKARMRLVDIQSVREELDWTCAAIISKCRMDGGNKRYLTWKGHHSNVLTTQHRHNCATIIVEQSRKKKKPQTCVIPSDRARSKSVQARTYLKLTLSSLLYLCSEMC